MAYIGLLERLSWKNVDDSTVRPAAAAITADHEAFSLVHAGLMQTGSSKHARRCVKETKDVAENKRRAQQRSDAGRHRHTAPRHTTTPCSGRQLRAITASNWERVATGAIYTGRQHSDYCRRPATTGLYTWHGVGTVSHCYRFLWRQHIALSPSCFSAANQCCFIDPAHRRTALYIREINFRTNACNCTII